MNVVVTGANGFLGRHVVAELLRRGHRVRAVVRPVAHIDKLPWRHKVDFFRSDLRTARNLHEMFDGADALVHLAAGVRGDEEAQFADTAVATERLLAAMARTACKHVLLASSISVYDWSATRGTMTEESPVGGPDIYKRDGYAVAKFWQERVTRKFAAQNNWKLTVLRPGFIWGRGNEYLAGIGQKVGRLHLLMGGLSRLPITHAENCADCFAEALENPKAAGETYNVFDGHSVRNWRYTGEYLRRTGEPGFRIPVPYRLAYSAAVLAFAGAKWVFGPKAKLPGLFVPIKFEARFKPLCYSTRKLREHLGWTPKLTFEQCLDRTYGEAEPTPELRPQPQVLEALGKVWPESIGQSAPADAPPASPARAPAPRHAQPPSPFATDPKPPAATATALQD